MATTGRVIEPLATSGARTSAGAAVASGLVRFYQPGTSTAANVYTDDACTAAASQPVTLDAGGRAKLFLLDPVRMVIKDSTDATTILDTVLVQRHDQQYVTHASFNGGTETTLESVLTTMATSLGTSCQYKESTGATARNYVSVLGERCVSVTDFGATGNGVTDDTAAIQAALDRVKARGGGIVLVPYGNFHHSGLSITAVGVSLVGTGRNSILTNTSTTSNSILVDVGSAVDCRARIANLDITAATTSSGSAIHVDNGARILIEDVTIALHRTAIDGAAVADARVDNCAVLSTDNNASCVGISLGTRGRVTNTTISGIAQNGKAIITALDDCVVDNVVITNFALGIEAGGSLMRISNLRTVGSFTGVASTGGGTHANNLAISGATNGYLQGTGNGDVISGAYISAGTAALTLGGNSCRASNLYVVDGTMTISGDYGSLTDSNSTGGHAVTISGDYCSVKGCQFTGGEAVTISGLLCTMSDSTVIGGAATGVTVSGIGCKVTHCHIAGATTAGVALTGGNCVIQGCTVNGLTTATNGVTVDAGANGCYVTDNYVYGVVTNGINVGAVTGGVVVRGNSFDSVATYSWLVDSTAVGVFCQDNNGSFCSDAATGRQFSEIMARTRTKFEVAAEHGTYSPNIAYGPQFTVCQVHGTYNGAQDITINNLGAGMFVPGQMFALMIENEHAGGTTLTPIFQSEYQSVTGETVSGQNLAQHNSGFYLFVYNGAAWICVVYGSYPHS